MQGILLNTQEESYEKLTREVALLAVGDSTFERVKAALKHQV